MKWDKQKERELAFLVDRFSSYIRSQIQKYFSFYQDLDIDDIFQETRIKLWKIVQSEKKISNYASYIRKIVNTSIMDFFRKLKRDEGIFIHEKNRKIEETRLGNYIFTDYDQEVIKNTIFEALNNLIESRRKVVKLYLLNLNIKEISLFYHWSEHKTRNLLYRGLLDLKNILKEKNINYEYHP
ncbi:MAG: RNA polymerase sigma factor [Candidatus Omnitrophica bacterium]|nr:RNA polymerase sigma factor [Candidatus Omnitrophota bacterium]